MLLRQLSFGRALGLATCLGTALVACVDLFHSTNFETLCDVDAAACAPADGAAQDAGSPDVVVADAGFCQWDAATARTNAQHACAWLGACEGPLGDNAFGPCMVNATLAYDCAANPNRPVIGAAYLFWDQLWRAKSCADVAKAIEPSTVTCVTSTSAYGACSTSTLLECGADGGAPLGVESCAGLGQACTTAGETSACGGPSACSVDAGGALCAKTTWLQDCDADGGFDNGVDCSSFGAGTCASGACLAVGGTACVPTSQVICGGDGGNLSQGCPSGVTEQVDCSAVLETSGSCNASADGRPWDVSRACSVGTGTCPPDSCADSSILSACARGATISIDCTTVGLPGCTPSSLPGAPAACAPPSL